MIVFKWIKSNIKWIPSYQFDTNICRFISLATPEENVQEFSILMHKYKERGNIFIERVELSKTLIACFARPFIRNNMVSFLSSRLIFVFSYFLNMFLGSIWYHSGKINLLYR